MNVPLCDLKAQYKTLEGDIKDAIQCVLDRGNYVMGEEVQKFEEEWAAFCQAKYCVAVSSGTDALFLTLRAAIDNYTHNIITTPTTFYATTQAILSSRKEPDFYDIDETGNLPDQYFGYRWALPVNLYGRPGKWTGERVIVDAAQSHGIPLRSEVAHCFSFYPTKNLGAMGQAGAVVTNDEALYREIKELRTYGERARFVHHAMTGNHRMDEIQAAILRVKLPHLKGWNRQRREIAKLYGEGLKDLVAIALPLDHPEHVYHIYAIRCKKRDALAEYLGGRGIQTSVRYPVPMHLQPLLQQHGYHYILPNAEAWANETLSLPMYPELPNEAVEYVCQSIREWEGRKLCAS